jgi:putative transposase
MRYGTAEIFNMDRGSQFTTPLFTVVLERRQIRISMGGHGRWPYRVFIERLWRWLKYECVYLHAFETGSGLGAGLPNGSPIITGSVRARHWLDARLMRRVMMCRCHLASGLVPGQMANSSAVRTAA